MFFIFHKKIIMFLRRKYILKLISQSEIRKKKDDESELKYHGTFLVVFFNLNQITNTRKREEEIRKQKDEFNRLQNEIKQLQEESLRKENQQKIIEKIEKQHQEELQILKYKEQNRQYEELIYNIQTQNTQEMKVLSDQIKILQNELNSAMCFIM